MGDHWIELLHRLAPLLPATSFDRLRAFPGGTVLPTEQERAFSSALQQAVADLDSLHHTLTTFLPHYLLDLSPMPGEPRGELLEGSFIFADVTGFTALTGELSARGTQGREEMNRLMRTLFAALLDPLLASGGDLLIFAGDAVLAYFPAQPQGQDARWAARTALRLVKAIAPFADLETPYGRFSLTMSAGVERGTALAAAVGTRQRMELLISGGPVQGAMQAEGRAAPGQVTAGEGARPFLRVEEFLLRGEFVEGLRGGELDDYEMIPPARRRRRLSTLFSRRIPDLIEHVEKALAQVESLVPFIPPDLFRQIARGEDIRQHPPVAVQFVNLLGIEELALGPAADPERATEALQQYFVRAQEIVADREGIISQVDPYAHGFTLLNPFGAPTHHEGVPRLAASAALELGRALERINRELELDPPLVQRVGMTYDRIFTGEIGYRHRREYVVAGPAVNLAARLMSKAEPGQVVLDSIAWEAVQEDFVADRLPPIPLKGIADPVPRFLLQSVRRGKGHHIADYPLVGRRRERAVLETLLGEAAAGRGGALILVGEAGFGKNRLAAAVAEEAGRQEMAVLTGRCHPFAQGAPYRPWADLVEAWFELEPSLPPEARRRELRGHLARLDLVSHLPALADLLGLPAAGFSPGAVDTAASARQGPGLFATLRREAGQGKTDTQELASLLTRRAARAGISPAGEAGPSIWEVLRERASIPGALTRLLEQQARRRPTLVVIEDLQWMDPDSREVLKRVNAAAHRWPLLLLVTARPGTAWPGDRLVLPPLSEADSCALAALALRAAQLEPDLASWLMARGRGNPLFLLSYCRVLRDAEAVVVDPGSDEGRWSGPPPALPLSLQELLLAEVNRLEREARDVLRRAAVVGVTFPVRLLSHLCCDAFLPGQLSQALDELARRSLITPPPPARAYTFSSQSLHDAVYATLSHAARRSWHEQVGDYLAEADEAVRYERLEQIAYHYSRSDNARQEALFTRLAGDKARARRADEAALAFYSQTLGAEDGEAVAAEQRRAREGIGDIHALRGELEAARGAYYAALTGASPPHTHRLRAKLALASPLIDSADEAALEKAGRELPASDPLRPWLGAARVWLTAAWDEPEAVRVCRELLPAAGEPVKSLLQEALQNLEQGEPLRPYADFFALFARSRLRLLPGGES